MKHISQVVYTHLTFFRDNSRVEKHNAGPMQTKDSNISRKKDQNNPQEWPSTKFNILYTLKFPWKISKIKIGRCCFHCQGWSIVYMEAQRVPEMLALNWTLKWLITIEDFDAFIGYEIVFKYYKKTQFLHVTKFCHLQWAPTPWVHLHLLSCDLLDQDTAPSPVSCHVWSSLCPWYCCHTYWHKLIGFCLLKS